MFELKKISKEGMRLGSLRFGDKHWATPAYFMTLDFGGGAGDLYRIVTYIDLLEATPIPTLLNFYFLTIERDLARQLGIFRVGWIDYIPKFIDILDFFSFVREQFLQKGLVRKHYPRKSVNWQPITMLDSGSGNILRDFIDCGKTTMEALISSFKGRIKEYHKFATEHCFNIIVAMDFAKKRTYKKGERKDKMYTRISEELSQDIPSNLQLLEKTLDIIKDIDSDCMTYAPVHGESPEQCKLWIRKILELEKEKKANFSGFAIGARELAFAKFVRQALSEAKDGRPLHALGVGDVSNIIPLVAFGVDTFDCHTAWRRAIDGNKKSAKLVFRANKPGLRFSKFLIPIIDSNGQIIPENRQNALRYIKLPDVPNSIVCDCEICRNFSLEEIRELYSQEDEDFYFARMLMYFHAILQHEYLCARLRREIEEDRSVVDFIKELPDVSLRNKLLTTVKVNFKPYSKLNKFMK